MAFTLTFFGWNFPIFQRRTRFLRTINRTLIYRSHFTIPLLSFTFILAICYLVGLVGLGAGFPYAFPLSRTLFIAILVAIPIWGCFMSVLYFLRSFGVPPLHCLWTWRHHHQHGVEENDFMSGANGKKRQRRPSALWLAYLFVAVCGVYLISTYELPIDHRFKPMVELASRVPKREGYGTSEKVFIAAMFYNNAYVLPYWITEVTKLINYLGPDNVFVSVVESYSSDRSPALLREFETKLEKMGVPCRILTQDTSIARPSSMATSQSRIDFLAGARNLVLEPLAVHGGYDRVLFSNDVFVEAESIVELLNTNGGEYDMACSLDFQQWGLYDIWVTRDRLGRIVSGQWPYFFEETGLRAVMANKPAPVFTCWNGIVSIRAEPFFPVQLRKGGLSTSPLAHPLPPTHPAYSEYANSTPASMPPLRFRSSAPTECFSSESFNLPYDLRRLFALDRIYANPRVITAYKWRFYLWFKYAMRHWAMRWFMKRVERRSRIHVPQFVLGESTQIWKWDGGECHPGGGLSLVDQIAVDPWGTVAYE
ncbi:cryptococcal mannosyltransferase 1-domain-containing protein [Mycena capillaripes]|nr:cryptococcal mannosyltransferase 1-domain-containing protein [Mycena capillaripes]